MSLQMIHEAYKPVYIYVIQFFLADALTNGLMKVFYEALADLKRDESIFDYRSFSQEKNGSTHTNQSNSQASQDIHEVCREIVFPI